MSLLRKAVNEQAFLKAGILGFPGSGKTYTAAHLALAIAKSAEDSKPVAFFDTETGSDFLIGRFQSEGVELMVAKSQAFKDLIEVAKEAQGQCSVLIVDSITHVWRELCDAYARRKGIKRMGFEHWAEVKREWSTWTTLYLNSRIHIFVLGRAGYEYDFEVNEDTGKKDLIKTGTKMRVEGEFGFEPSLLIEMERVSRGADAGSGWTHRAHILKDRTDTINGKAFDFNKLDGGYKVGDWRHTFEPFAPAFAALNRGGDQIGVDDSRRSDALFESGGDGAANRYAKVQIALEHIENTLVLLWPGHDAKSKAIKLAVVDVIYGERSWKAVERKSLEALHEGIGVLSTLERMVKARPEGIENADDARAMAQMAKEKFVEDRAALAAEQEKALEEAVL
jgi:hypothetical protein